MNNRVNPFQPAEDLPFLVSPSTQDQSADLPLELRELLEQEAATSVLTDESAATESDWPVSVFVPERYEEGYAYPLVIWFHDEGSSEDNLESVMNAVSPQNYCGLSLRGNRRLDDDTYGWDHGTLEFGRVPVADLVNVTARRLRKAFHIHSERIFVAGKGSGADVAITLMLQHSDWFAGAVLIDAPCDLGGDTEVNTEGLRGKRVLQTVSRKASNETLAHNVELVRLLKSCGTDIDVRMTDGLLDVCSKDVRFVDHWLVSSITGSR